MANWPPNSREDEDVASAQVSVYPLRQDRLEPAIDVVRAALLSHGLAPQVGPMSTTVIGEDIAIAAAFCKGVLQSRGPGGATAWDFVIEDPVAAGDPPAPLCVTRANR